MVKVEDKHDPVFSNSCGIDRGCGARPFYVRLRRSWTMSLVGVAAEALIYRDGESCNHFLVFP